MASPIQKKIQELRARNFNFGNKISDEHFAGLGVRLAEYENVNIYYHVDMNNKAHEVHGGILRKYLQTGGHTGGVFGIPFTDEEISADGRCPVSKFRKGAIYMAFGGEMVYGKFYTFYRNAGGETGRLGYPVADPVQVAGGEALFFEHGCLYIGERSGGVMVELKYDFPKMGNPWMMRHEEMRAKVVIRLKYPASRMTHEQAGRLIHLIFKDRIFLRETGSAGELPLTFNPQEVAEIPAPEGWNSYWAPMAVTGGRSSAVKNNRLYDIILKFPDRVHIQAPHAVYLTNKTWSDFKFIHATDTHVSRRIDKFRRFFSDRRMRDAVANLNNFNDRFRELIIFANKLHRRGDLDFIMITGDLVDYIFEDGGNTYHNNNFVFFEMLVRGQTGKPDQVQNEELLVPIITSLGNHDYRVRAYYPVFTVDAPFPISNKSFKQHGPLNITEDEARLLTREQLGIRSMISGERAFKMIRPDKNNDGGNLDHYFRHICRQASFSVKLGKHNVIMIDGKWDDGTIDDTWDAIKYALGIKGETNDNFVDGTPDSVGFTTADCELVRIPLLRDGLVIVGVHAPIMNPKKSEYAYFMREHLRGLNNAPYRAEMRKHLFRLDPAAFVDEEKNGKYWLDLRLDKHKDWSRERTPFYHLGKNGEDMLDTGIKRSNREKFMQICTGAKFSKRPADLILSGHVHKNWETRLIYNPAQKKFRYHYDFYTENPSVYYHSYNIDVKTDEPFSVKKTSPSPASQLEPFVARNQVLINVSVTEEAQLVEQPVKNNSGVWWIKTQPFPLTLNSLNGAGACKGWWDNIRPLFIQTAALGPSEYLRGDQPQPDFRGCRYIAVGSDVIQKIHYITQADMQAVMNDPFGGTAINEVLSASSPNLKVKKQKAVPGAKTVKKTITAKKLATKVKVRKQEGVSKKAGSKAVKKTAAKKSRKKAQ